MELWVWVTLAVGCGAAVGGALVARSGFRPGRTGAAAHCRKCDYLVGGLAQPRCPECGSDLSAAGAVVSGGRVVRPGRGWLGVGMFCAGLAAAYVPLMPTVRARDWYRHRPTGWVVDDLGSRDRATSERAWREIERRVAEQSLSPSQLGGVADAVLGKLERDPAAVQSPQASYLLGGFSSLSADRKDRLFRSLLAAVRGTTPQVSAQVSSAARRHLEPLLASGALSPENQVALADAGIEAQGSTDTGPQTQWLVAHAARRELEGGLTEAQRAKFLRQANDLFDLRVRPRAQVGTPVPYAYRTRSHVPRPEPIRPATFPARPATRPARPPPGAMRSVGTGWWTSQRMKRITLDGVEMFGGAGMTSGVPTGPSVGDVQSSLTAGGPGTRVLEIVFELGVYHGPLLDAQASSVRSMREVKLRGEFELVGAAVPDVTWVEDPGLEHPMRTAFGPRDVRRMGPRALMLLFDVDPAPAGGAFEVFVVADGREQRAGKLAVRAGQRMPGVAMVVQNLPPTPEPKVDIVLRASAKVARESADVTEAWKGDLVYKAVKVLPQ